MHNVEPYRIETTRERLTFAVDFAKASMAKKPDVEGLTEDKSHAILDDIKILEIGIESHKEEMKAVYYTLRLRGVEEVDFPDHVGSLTVDDIFIAVELSTTNEDEIIAYTLDDEKQEEPEQAV